MMFATKIILGSAADVVSVFAESEDGRGGVQTQSFVTTRAGAEEVLRTLADILHSEDPKAEVCRREQEIAGERL